MPRRPQFPTYELGNPMPLVNGKAVSITVDADVSSSTAISINPETNFVRIFAKAQGIYVKGGVNVSESTWDWFIPANGIVDIIVPDNVSTMSVIEETAGAKLILAQYS